MNQILNNFEVTINSMKMEGMLNKLKSTVSSAASNAVSNAVSIASQVSNYLPGNPVTRDFEATEHIGSAGRGKLLDIDLYF